MAKLGVLYVYRRARSKIMVHKKLVHEQLKKIGFDAHGWNSSEVDMREALLY
jgi:hypothetical protein